MPSDVGESYNRYSIAIPTQVDQNARKKEKDRRERRRKIERERLAKKTRQSTRPLKFQKSVHRKGKLQRKENAATPLLFVFPLPIFIPRRNPL